MVSRAQHACDPADVGARRQHSRCDRCLGDHPARSWQAWARQPAAACDQGRGRGLCRSPRIAFSWKNEFDKLKKGTNTERYLLPHGKAPVAGDVIHQPELGQTLRAIARGGRDAFYKGAIAEDMVETLRGIGGLHTLDDFAAHTTETT